MKGSVSAKTLKGALNSPQSVSGKAIPRGNDGISPTLDVTEIPGGHRVVINDIEGEKPFDIMDGRDGKDGEDGKDGVSPTHSWNGTTLVVTSASGTSFADLKGDTGEPGYTPKKGVDYFDGKDGKDGTMTFEELTEEQKASLKGEDGKDGVSPSVTIANITGGHRVTITDYSGTKSFDVMDGEGATVTLEELGGVSEERFSVAETDISNLRSDVNDLLNHMNSKNNPHGVTASQTGAATVQDVLNALPTWNGGSY